jgi:predicted ATPase
VLDSLSIQGFKCFEDVTLPLRKLNIFSGTNSSGKSTAIQAFLLLCNNASDKVSNPLNGMWLRLGSFDECRNRRINARDFTVEVTCGSQSLSVSFLTGEEIFGVEVTYRKLSQEILNLLNLENRHVHYLPANRTGPEDSYDKNFDKRNFLGNRAEYVVDYLYENRKNNILPALVIDDASVTLESQVNYWLHRLFGISNVIRDLGLSNSLLIEYSHGGGKAVRPYHMGSGVSFALGLLVSCLSAEPDDIVIIENPEIHLHPKAQSELTEFLCFVANAGIQVVIETHSDHIFNGARKAIVKKRISNVDVGVQFFHLDSNYIAHSTKIEINEHGRVLTPVDGLFDQFDDDLDAILGI